MSGAIAAKSEALKSTYHVTW